MVPGPTRVNSSVRRIRYFLRVIFWLVNRALNLLIISTGCHFPDSWWCCNIRQFITMVFWLEKFTANFFNVGRNWYNPTFGKTNENVAVSKPGFCTPIWHFTTNLAHDRNERLNKNAEHSQIQSSERNNFLKSSVVKIFDLGCNCDNPKILQPHNVFNYGCIGVHL